MGVGSFIEQCSLEQLFEGSFMLVEFEFSGGGFLVEVVLDIIVDFVIVVLDFVIKFLQKNGQLFIINGVVE